MKIAAVTDDGITLSEHFGQATRYVVMTVTDGQVVDREERAKPACDHHHGAGEAHEHAHASEDPTEKEDDGPDLHTRMTNVIADCEAVIARGVPRPMFNHLIGAGIRPLITSLSSVEDAMDAFLTAGASESSTR